MRRRTIKCSLGGSIVLRPDEHAPDHYLRLVADNIGIDTSNSVRMARGSVEKLRDALQDWLESGDR